MVAGFHLENCLKGRGGGGGGVATGGIWILRAA